VASVDAVTTHDVVLVKVTTPALIEQPPLTPNFTGSPADDVATGVYVELIVGDVGAVEVIVTVGVASVKAWADDAEVAVPYVPSAAMVAVT
jgi:hypothetical protein